MPDDKQLEKTKKELVLEKDDIDDVMDMVMQAMIIVIIMSVMLPMLPIAQSAQRYYDSQVYQGQSDSRRLDVTDIMQHVVLANPWVGAFFINDGPGTVEVRLNDEESFPYVLAPLETRTISRLGADNRIYAIYYVCPPGQTSTIRAEGAY